MPDDAIPDPAFDEDPDPAFADGANGVPAAATEIQPDAEIQPDVQPDVDPDARFLLANERTLLAWIRTALALLAGGVGLLQFLPDVPLNDVVGLGMLALGSSAFLIGLQRYRAADAALRANQLPPRGLALEIVTFVLFLLAVALIVVLMTHRATTI